MGIISKGPDRINSVFWPTIEMNEEPIFHWQGLKFLKAQFFSYKIAKFQKSALLSFWAKDVSSQRVKYTEKNSLNNFGNILSPIKHVFQGFIKLSRIVLCRKFNFLHYPSLFVAQNVLHQIWQRSQQKVQNEIKSIN